MAITATMVKDLRDKTGAGMMDCKAALAETSGDMEAAVDWLRAKGLAKAAKKAGRVAAEGLIGLAADAKHAALVEVNSETDFVARNETFQKMASRHRRSGTRRQGRSRQARQGQVPRRQGQRRRYHQGDDRHDRREHDAPAHGLSRREDGRGGELRPQPDGAGTRQDRRASSALESTGDAEALKSFGRQVAMHIAAANPQAVDVESLDQAARSIASARC